MLRTTNKLLHLHKQDQMYKLSLSIGLCIRRVVLGHQLHNKRISFKSIGTTVGIFYIKPFSTELCILVISGNHFGFLTFDSQYNHKSSIVYGSFQQMWTTFATIFFHSQILAPLQKLVIILIDVLFILD